MPEMAAKMEWCLLPSHSMHHTTAPYAETLVPQQHSNRHGSKTFGMARNGAWEDKLSSMQCFNEHRTAAARPLTQALKAIIRDPKSGEQDRFLQLVALMGNRATRDGTGRQWRLGKRCHLVVRRKTGTCTVCTRIECQIKLKHVHA